MTSGELAAQNLDLERDILLPRALPLERGKPMRRREFIVRLGGAISLWPVAARAQQGHKLPVVGLVSIGASVADPANFRPFLEQMSKLGYEDGQNIIFDCGDRNPRGSRCKVGNRNDPHRHLR